MFRYKAVIVKYDAGTDMHEVQYEDESQEWISMATLQWSKQVEIIRYKTVTNDLVKLQCDICGCWTHLPNYVTKESVLQPWTCAGIHWRADVHCLPTHPSVFIGGVKCAHACFISLFYLIT